MPSKLHQDEPLPVMFVTLRRAQGFYSGPADARRQRRAMARKAAKEAARKGKGGNHA